MTQALRLDEAAQLLGTEALYLDTQRWDDWLSLFLVDAWYWVPAWRADHELVDDPQREISLIHYAARAGLEDRVWRVRSGLSAASVPLPRTSHIVGSVCLVQAEPDQALVHAAWSCHRLDLRGAQVQTLFGRYEHHLRRTADGWRIAGKKVVLMNECIPTMIDFYCV